MKNMIITDQEYIELEEIYKLFGSVPRLKILLRLNECESTAGDLALACGLSQSATSHQLKELRDKRIVKSTKDGLNILYSLDDKHIVDIIESGINHVKHVYYSQGDQHEE